MLCYFLDTLYLSLYCLSNCLSLEGNDTDIKPKVTVMILNDHSKSTDNYIY